MALEGNKLCLVGAWSCEEGSGISDWRCTVRILIRDIKSSRELIFGIHKTGAKQGPWCLSAEVAGCGLQVSSSKELRGLSARAQARRICTSTSFSVAGFSPFLCPPRSAMRRGAWKCNTESRYEGCSVSRPHCLSHCKEGAPCILQTAA